ncbi:DUF4192 domain-containing protein [Haloglycomyces albus]|uniref:DUF4192 domain-containing protein n=1 Tax=Haloglycomyces albus TaxID=526067 RepID=UPI00046D7EE2|nr:DUF4192 domain-containing protein [Haloglycomyces albus]
MTTAANSTNVHIDSAADLAGLIPYLLGYEPESDSVVLVGLRHNLVRCALRVRVDDGEIQDSDVEHYVVILRHNGCDRLAIIGYGAAGALLDKLRQRCEHDTVPMRVIVTAQVRDGYLYPRWPDPDRSAESVPTASPAVCAMIAAGGSGPKNRRDLARLFKPAERRECDKVARALEEQRRRQADDDTTDPESRGKDLLCLDYWRQQTRLPEAAEIAEIALALSDVEVRDWLLDCMGDDPGQNNVDLWIWAARHLRGTPCATVACVAAFAAYRCGNGVVAAEAVDCALRANPRYRLAALLWEALQRGIPPHRLGRRTLPD